MSEIKMKVEVMLRHPIDMVTEDDVREAILKMEMHHNATEPTRAWVKEMHPGVQCRCFVWVGVEPDRTQRQCRNITIHESRICWAHWRKRLTKQVAGDIEDRVQEDVEDRVGAAREPNLGEFLAHNDVLQHSAVNKEYLALRHAREHLLHTWWDDLKWSMRDSLRALSQWRSR